MNYPWFSGVRWGFTAWMAYWVPVSVWAYGPLHFLWLCDLAQLIILYALWTNNRLLLSSQAGVVCLIGLIWSLDFALAVMTGGRVVFITGYMFNADLPLLARAGSLYHLFLPPLLLWCLHRLGYDRRGPRLQSVIGTLALVATWLWTEPADNINWLAAPFNIDQAWLPDALWLVLMVLAYPLLLYWPGHWLVIWLRRRFR